MAQDFRITDLLHAGLKASALRGKVIANNIANLETPGFRQSSVRFEQELLKALKTPGKVDLEKIKAQAFKPMSAPVDGGGNDVNIDAQVGKMIKNSARYKLLMRLLVKNYQQMEEAMGR